ncbi:MAG: 3-deoxy-manno-octulosonate cytidylyltransferase [SAR324 cluster bacterium]|uniref:3-deoxy-manno-octulosonate cytidylyltransferase n=1 Tax=SAR324 cluster bacterium TaxID=2024889 RepID=A0A7X9FPN4_9DELT|nr:3-deoxy-manno-octulosonate cytidylyltransferase [SAR324 cluster bacterium]
MSTCLAIIPARYASERLPSKLVQDIGGKSLLCRVWEEASKSTKISELVIAADSTQIEENARSFRATVVNTKSSHSSSIERVAEVVEQYKEKSKSFDMVVSIPGDLPFFNPELVDGVIRTLEQCDSAFGAATVAAPIHLEDEFNRNTTVKVVLGSANQAVYFSYAPVPWIKHREDLKGAAERIYGHRQFSIYAFRPDALLRAASQTPTVAEKRERLEGLRLVCGGIQTKVFVIPRTLAEPFIEVDTREDLERAIAYARTKSSTGRAIPSW